MSKEQENKAIIGQWFAGFWGNPWNPEIINELAAPDMLLQYSLHNPRRGHADIEAFMTGFREAFPDLKFEGAEPVAQSPSGTSSSCVSALTGLANHDSIIALPQHERSDGAPFSEAGTTSGLLASGRHAGLAA